MGKIAVILMILAILSKIFGFAREITLSYFYGVSSISDIYLIAITIPTAIFSFIGIGLATSYMPIYSAIVKKEGQQMANRVTNNLINFVLLLCTVVILVTLVFTTPIIRLFASGFDKESLEVAVLFTRVSIFAIYFMALTTIFKGYLEIQKSFIAPALIGVPYNLAIMLSIILSTKTDSIILPMGIVAAVAIQLMLLLPFSRKKGFRYIFTLDLKDKYLRKILYLSLPVILGASVNQINVLVDRTIASQIAVGGISALNYADKLGLFIQGIFVVSLTTVMYPMITKMAVENDIRGLKKAVSETIGSINLFIMPVTVGAMVFAEPIVYLLFSRGAFDDKAVNMTSSALFFYSIGMVAFGLRQVLSRAFYSLQDTKTPMINAAIGMAVNIVLNIILSRFLGIGGLALATSISAILTTGLLFISLRKKIGSFGMKSISSSFLKILIASLVMGLASKAAFEYLRSDILSQNLSLIASIGVGAIVYSVIIFFMKIDYVDDIVDIIKKRLKKNTE